MGRGFGRGLLLAFVAVCLSGLSACGGGGNKGTPLPTPSSISLTPANAVSLDLGATQAFTPTVHSATSTNPINEPVIWQTSNASVITIANNGLACAGTWNSLTSPQVCTPGSVGTAQVTASAMGIISPPTTVYVHQHIDSIQISAVPTSTPAPPCISKDLTADYQATAFSRGIDVTPTVGPFTWNSSNSQVLSISTTASGLQPGQAQFTGHFPGVTQVFASAANTNSVPAQVTVCPVESIALALKNSAQNSFTVTANGAAPQITATVTDSQGVTITGIPLTWCTSNPASVVTGGTATSNCSTNQNDSITPTAPAAGGATITASCSPPNCNLGLTPSLPIYATNAIGATVTHSASTTVSGTTWVTSTACGTNSGCVSTLVSINLSNNTIATQTRLPATPNSLVFEPHGSTAYLGTDLSLLGTRGLMVFNATASIPQPPSQITSVIGRVLAVSPDGQRVIVSDTTSTPNQVFLVDNPTGTSPTTSNFAINGATAAAFSPDNLKAFVVAGSNLYIFSKQDPPQTIALNAPVFDVATLGNGVAAYMAGGDPAGASFVPTCTPAPVAIGAVNAPGATLIRALPDGQTMLTLNPTSIQTIGVNLSSNPASVPVPGCPLALGLLTLTNTVNAPVNLGQGSLTPTQLLVSSDGTRAYILASNLSTVLVFDVANQTTSAIALANNASPIHASLTVDGTRLYVGASDGDAHVIDTVSGSDIQQITLQNNAPLRSLCLDTTGNPFPLPGNATCLPDLIAVRP